VDTIVVQFKKCAPILGYKLPSDKLTELVVRKAKPISKPKKLTVGVAASS
jgi:hypothetical protein